MLVPLFLLTPFIPPVKIGVLLIGVIYCIYTSIKQNVVSKKELYQISLKGYWPIIGITFVLLIVLTTSMMYVSHKDLLFKVVLKKPVMWISIVFFYSIFSVYPQEFLYRSFFFNRYQTIFKNKYTLIITNAVLFSLAHLVFQNLLVSILTFIGGLLFATTYYRSKSLLLTSLEHAIYGSWLFTVGMGEMLAFPMPQ